MNDRSRLRARMGIYAIAGLYLLYQAFELFKAFPDSSGTEKLILGIAMIVFAVIGTGLVIWGLGKNFQMRKEAFNTADQIPEADTDPVPEEKSVVFEEISDRKKGSQETADEITSVSSGKEE